MFKICRLLCLGALLSCPLSMGAAAGPAKGGAPVPSIAKASHVVKLKVFDQVTLLHGPLTNTKFVIRDSAAWLPLAAKDQAMAKLKIDFSKQMVLVVAENVQVRVRHMSNVEMSATFACIPQVQAVLHFEMTAPWIPIPADLVTPNHFIVVERSDAPVQFSEVVHNPWLHLQLPAVAEAGLVPANWQPKLSVAVAGADLVVSTTITANNSPHALQTSYLISGNGQVHLKYVLIQNADLLVRSQKQITVKWRLTGMAVAPLGKKLSYQVEPTNLVVSTSELFDLLPQLHGLHKAGLDFKNAIPHGEFVQ